MKTRHPVLIVLWAANYAEAYADDDVDIKFVDVPHVERETGSEQLEAERLGDEWLHGALPHRWHELYIPGNMRKNHDIIRVRPTQIKRADDQLQFMRELDGIKNGATANHGR